METNKRFFIYLFIYYERLGVTCKPFPTIGQSGAALQVYLANEQLAVIPAGHVRFRAVGILVTGSSRQTQVLVKNMF